VKLVSSASVIAALLVAMASAGPASAATETVSLGFNEDTGPEPAPLFEPAAVENPVSFRVTYTATPAQPIEIRQGLNCVRGSETPGVPEKPETVTPPASISLTAPAGSDSCTLVAFAETPVVTGVFGTVRISGEAIRVAKSLSTPQSAPKKKRCRKGRKLKHGKCVKKGRKRR
jgi:hypothetical protein